MKYPLLTEYLSRERWAISEESLQAIMRIVEGDTEPQPAAVFHGAKGEMDTAAEVIGSGGSSGLTFGTVHGSTGIITINGPIVPRRGMEAVSQPRLTTTAELQQDFATLESADNVERIVLLIDSPGGAVSGALEFIEQIRASSKPTAAFVMGYGASLAYWFASATDEIAALKTALVGSVGTMATLRGGKDGKLEVFRSSQSPMKNIDPATEEGREYYQGVIDDQAAVFISTLAEFRGVSEGHVLKNFGRGGVMVADKALHAGMIDRVITFAEYIGALESGKIQMVKRKGVDFSKKDPEEMDQGHLGQQGDMKMELQEFLAQNPEAKAEHEAMIEKIKADAIAEAKPQVAPAQEAVKPSAEQVEFAAKIAASDAYPQSVRDKAVQVLTGKASAVALESVVAVADMDRERAEAAKAAAESAALGDTPADAQTKGQLSTDGGIRNMADVAAHLRKE